MNNFFILNCFAVEMGIFFSKLLQQAIKVLRDLNAKFYEDLSNKKPLLEDEKQRMLYLQLSLKRIPKCKSIKMIKINLPHSLVKDNSEVCLITGDLDKKNHKAEIEPDVLHYKDLLKKHSIDNISEVVTLRQLRTEYKPYEAKQKLLAAYDVFLADRKIAECLPRVLGRHFYKKRKFPIQITLNTPNLKQQVEKALSTKVFYLTGHGNSCNSEVAYLDMADKEISENVIEMVKAFCDKLPGSWDNVMGIYLKTSLSKAVPVYMSYDDPNKVHLEEEKHDNSYEIDELSTCPDRLVKVYKDGSVRTVRVKRMAEAERFETANGGENSDMEEQKTENVDDCLNLGNADLNGETADVTKNKKKKKENHMYDSLQNTDLKEESPKIKKKSKNKKSKDIILEEETNQLLCTMEVKEESPKIKKESKNKKSKDIILEEETNQSLCTMEEKEESPKIKKKSKSKKSKDIILEETNQSLCTMEEKEESSEIQSHKKSKNKRKSIGSVLGNEVCDNTAGSELKSKSGDLNKKPKSSRKSMGNILRKDDESLISSQLKNKQKKRKSIL